MVAHLVEAHPGANVARPGTTKTDTGAMEALLGNME